MAESVDKQQLRKILRKQRTAISEDRQRLHAHAIAKLFQEQETWMKQGEHVALYLSVEGEINPEYIADMLWQHGRHCYLPVIPKDKQGPLLFAPWDRNSVMVPNRYGICEPKYRSNDLCCAEQMDVICLPLVGFDQRGHRLGMGGGFYDHTMAERAVWQHKPVLLGLAHAIQCIDDGLPNEPWDVALDAVITEKRVYCF